MDLETRTKAERASNEYFNKNHSIYNYPVELEELKVNAEEFLELIEKHYWNFWRDDEELTTLCSKSTAWDSYSGEETWEEFLEKEIIRIERKIDFYERYSKIANMRIRQKIKNGSRIKN